MNKLKRFFDKPKAPLHRQYEALRSIFVDKNPAAIVAKKYGYSISTIYSLARDFKSGKLSFFQTKKPGPIGRKMPKHMRQLVLNCRKENLSAKDIRARLELASYKCSIRTVERVLADANIPKVQRRTHAELGKSLKNTAIPQRSSPIDFDSTKPFRYDCPVAGVFFFLPSFHPAEQ